MAVVTGLGAVLALVTAGAGPTVPAGPAVAPPLALAGWSAWTMPRRLEALAEAARDPRLDEPTTRFLSAHLGDRSALAVSRNLAANALLVQERPVEGVVDRLASAAADPAEDPTWRDFALQHLAGLALAHRAGNRAVAEALARVAAGDGPVAGTALLQLHRLDQDGGIGIADRRLRALLARGAAAANDPALAMTAVAVAGARGDRSLLPAVRVRVDDAHAAVRRSAVAALGLIGDGTDRERVARAAADPDASVRRAAAAAARRLDETLAARERTPRAEDLR